MISRWIVNEVVQLFLHLPRETEGERETLDRIAGNPAEIQTGYLLSINCNTYILGCKALGYSFQYGESYRNHFRAGSKF